MQAESLLTSLLKRTNLSREHVESLSGLERWMSPLAPEVALAFYDYISRDPEMNQIIWGVPGRVERLYATFAQWYRELFSGTYDAAYARRRARIGLVHARVGVRPAHLIPAFGIVQELTLEHMRNVLRGGDVIGSIEAFEKIMSVELALMQESYLQALWEGLRQGSSPETAVAEGADLLLAGMR